MQEIRAKVKVCSGSYEFLCCGKFLTAVSVKTPAFAFVLRCPVSGTEKPFEDGATYLSKDSALAELRVF